MTFPLFLRALSDDSSYDSASRRMDARPRPSVVATTPPTPRSLAPIDGCAIPELLARIRSNEREALASLYTATFPTLWSIAIAYTRSAATAEELVHDVFLRLWIRRESLTVDTDIRVYLATAVRNHARNFTKHERVVTAIDRRSSGIGAEPIALGQSLPAPNSAIEDDEFQAAYRRLLGTLTDRERTAVMLRWEEGFTLDQIAEVLAVSIEGARKIIARVQHKAQKVLAEFRG